MKNEIEKAGEFYLGKFLDAQGNLTDTPLLYPAKNLTTHAVCLGMTGSGKTGLAIDLLEEAGLNGLPSIIIDPKGDLGDLLLTFPDLSPEEFAPWVDPDEAAAKKTSIDDYAKVIAKKWQEGLTAWGQNGDRIRKLRDQVEMVIYTPASSSGIPLSILSSFAAPPKGESSSDLRDRVLSTTSSLLSLIGIDADPVKNREHILLSTIISQAWEKGIDVDLPYLIQQIQRPSFDKIGVLDLETFFPAKDRMALSINLNNLLASPSFQSWMEGEPLNIKQLLYTKEGKPKMSILSIAHLSDNERMFFVTLFLNEYLSWMRREPGTSNLRTVFYMDEIFGYFPPVANPPSKLPLITLLKQARAFGVGIVLATQNPVDLDYKGLSNCGTWFIGKLQTERDKAKVFEGIRSTSSTEISSDTFNKMIATTGNQNFILLSVYDKKPELFKSRWALSYLRGPLTLTQIQQLTKQSPERAEASSVPKREEKSNASQQPILSLGITQFFANRAVTRQQVPYQPMLAANVKLHFTDSKNQIDTWQNLFFMAPASEDGTTALWEQGENRPEVKNVLEKAPTPNSSFKDLPSGLAIEKNYSAFDKTLVAYLYEHQTLTIYRSPDLKVSSTINETEADFRNRISMGLQEKRDETISKIREKYKIKIASLNAKIQQSEEKVGKEKQQWYWKMGETFVSVLSVIAGAFLGKGITKGTINQAGTSMRRVGRVGKESLDYSHAEDSYKNYQEQLQDVQQAMEEETQKALKDMDATTLKIDTITIRLKKSDISVDKVALLWF